MSTHCDDDIHITRGLRRSARPHVGTAPAPRPLHWFVGLIVSVLALFTGVAHASAPTIIRAAGATSPAERLGVPEDDADDQRVIGYFPSWAIYERGEEVADIPGDLVTHVNYAFADLQGGKCVVGDEWADTQRPLATDDLSLPYRGNFNQLAVLKQAHPHLRTIISVGGSTWSGGFSSAVSTVDGRRTLAASCVAFMERYGFDGLSIDWEYPVSGGASPGQPADRANYTALIREIRAQLIVLDASAPAGHVLTIAGPAGAPNMANMDIAALAPLVDWVNVMSYDFAGAWSPATGHNSPLYGYPGIEDSTFTVDSAMQRWVGAGMPHHKLNTGLAFYGRSFGGVTTRTPGAPFGSTPMGTTEPGQVDYADLVDGALGNATVRFDADARVPYAYDSATDVWFSFDNPRSIEEKARYSRTGGYGGVLVWELSNDTEDDDLLEAVHRGLGR